MGRLKNPYLLSLVVSVENGSASRRPIRHGGGSGAWPSQRGQIPASGQDRRPADVLLPYWNGGKDAALDVTVVNPLQRATLPQAAIKPGHALQFAFERKINGAAEDCRRVWSLLVGGTKLPPERWRRWREPWQGTLARRRGRRSCTSGDD